MLIIVQNQRKIKSININLRAVKVRRGSIRVDISTGNILMNILILQNLIIIQVLLWKRKDILGKRTRKGIRKMKRNKEENIVPILPKMPDSADSGKLTIKDFPNYKKKVVVSNLPQNVSIDEIFTFINTYLSTVKLLCQNEETSANNDNKILENIQLVECSMRYAVIQINDKEDLEHCTTIDGTEWKGNKIRVRRPKKFIEDYNKEIDKKMGLMPIEAKNMAMLPPIPGQEDESENKIFMGSIPTSMSSEEVRKLCAGFGMLRSFNLMGDPNNKNLNKGFAFFEYTNEKDMEKAIKALDGFEILDKKLRVQKADVGAKPTVKTNQPTVGMVIQAHLKPEERVRIPLYALTPSRVVSFLNLMSPEDLLDESEKKEILRDLCDQCRTFGDVVDIKAPSPELATGHCTEGVGKIFVKFNHIVAAKQARFNLSGRRYRGKLVIGSFYPENYFDISEFDISAA